MSSETKRVCITRIDRLLSAVATELGAVAFQLDVYAAVEFCTTPSRQKLTTLSRSFGEMAVQRMSRFDVRDAAYGSMAELRLYGDEHFSDLRDSRVQEAACWIAAWAGLTPEIIGEMCIRSKVSGPALLMAKEAAGAAALIVWQYRRLNGSPTSTFKFKQAFGLPAGFVLDIPEGQGIVGKVGTEFAVENHDLTQDVDVYHPDLVVEQRWRSCEMHSLGDAERLYGAMALYFTTSSRDRESRGGRALTTRILLMARQVLLANFRSESLQQQLGDWQHDLADRATKLQAGLAVLGLAHDLAKRADTLEILTNTILENLPDDETKEGEAQLRAQLRRIGVPDGRTDLFLSAMQTAQEDASFIKEVIGQVNEIAKSKSRKRSKNSLRKLVEENRRILTSLCGKKATLRINTSAALHVRASSMDIGRILLNTVTNALNWRAKEIAITCSSLAELQDGWLPWMTPFKDDHCVLMIVDNGDGMSVEVAATALEPFSTDRSDGTGLGLFVVDRIAQELGGFVRISTRQRSGVTHSETIIYVVIPILEA